MKSSSYFSLFKIVLHGRSSGNILIATVMSFTFSIAVILCTVGLMDGFDYLLKSGLRHSSGDILITSKSGFFPFDDSLKSDVDSGMPRSVSPVIQTQGFALYQGKSLGVQVRGIEPKSFAESTGLSIHPAGNEIILGRELAKQLGVQPGDEMALALGKGNEAADSLPGVRVFKVGGIVEHGIYQKDLRFVYLARDSLAQQLDVGERVNLLILSTDDPTRPLKDLESVRTVQRNLRRILEPRFNITPFWSEYFFLIKAVEVEKFSISLILQLIVVVAVFNIIAFVIYIMEKKAQDFFFLRAVGLSLGKLMKFWLISIILVWIVSCAGAFVLTEIFNWALHHLSIFQIPGEIYVLSSLSVLLDLGDYGMVYGISLLWILLAGFVGYFRMRRRPIIQGLRQEFS